MTVEDVLVRPRTPLPPRPQSRNRRPRRALAGLLAVGCAVAGLALAGAALTDTGPRGPRPPAVTHALVITDATAAQSVGLVEIAATLDYGSGLARGTGMVVDADGLVVTNHHVVVGATDLRATVVATGRTYPLALLGSDPRADVAVLRLVGAPPTQPVTLASRRPGLGDEVTAVGDAHGNGGDLSAAPGRVSALDQAVSVQDAAGRSRVMGGLVEVTSDVVSGDSGGAVLDGRGDVVAMTTAARGSEDDPLGYAVPVADVLDVVAAVRTGQPSDRVTVGYPAFLGVEVPGPSSSAPVTS